MAHNTTIASGLTLLLLLGGTEAALGEQRSSPSSDNLVELQAAIEHEEGLLFRLEDLEALTALDPVPDESKLTTSVMGHDVMQDSLSACWGRCDHAHSVCLDSLWFFPGIRCKMKRDDCRRACALQELDRIFP